MKTAKQLHEKNELLIAQAKNLKGRATQLHTVPTNLPPVKLQGRQLHEAKNQFNIDVQKFKDNADLYRAHLDEFRKQVGECAAAQAAYKEACKRYEMHCQQYHMPNIEPPHICLEMDMSASQASDVAASLMNDQMRAIRAERELRDTNEKVRDLEQASAKADVNAEKQAQRMKREQELAAEFGRLRQEYDLLEIERKAIDHSQTASNKIVRPSVSAKIKKK